MIFKHLHPPHHEISLKDKVIEKIPAPKEVIIPLWQHAGTPTESRVKPGERVKIGTLLGDSDKRICAPVHSSVAGEVKEIKSAPHPTLGSSEAVIIKNDGSEQKIADIASSERADLNALSSREITEIIRQKGIVGLGGGAFPTHVKLNLPTNKKVDTFILNGAECEPYLCADVRLMQENASGIIKGLNIILKVLRVKQAFIAIEKNKPQAINTIKQALTNLQPELECETVKVVTVPARYPQGGEIQLIKKILNREVPPRGLPFDVGVVVNNVATAFAIYEAVYFNKPLYERALTVGGDCLKRGGNFLVRIGTPVSHIVDFLGGLVKEPVKVIMGGPMMGIAQPSLEVPVFKATTGILFFSKNMVRSYEEANCLRCARCVDACPMNLMPTQIRRLIKEERWEELKNYHIEDCIECGLCEYVCPANNNLVQAIKLAKQKLQELKQSS